MKIGTANVADLVQRMREKLKHGQSHRQKAMPVDIDDLRAIVLMGDQWLKVVKKFDSGAAMDKWILPPDPNA